ncbi:MAG: hypothetical protein KC729_13210 [Candidatus Eisenbacteria bacterium]|uniref:Uncharacterized protein n=1 Tax=Eiseniibacteriota bacterium TaxID=2212470 RepID=A0A956M045_UNCEI|nr:hypothetical protein [Candidatus Eisenbacteria bacterium]
MNDPSRTNQVFASILERAECAGNASQMRDVIQSLVQDVDAGDLGAFRDLLDVLQTEARNMAPTAWVEHAMARVRALEAERVAHTAPGSTIPSTVRRLGAAARQAVREILATLVLDSYEGAALPGIRGATRLQPRQLLYECPEGTIHLQIESDGIQMEILGQYLPTDGSPAGAVVALRTDAKSTDFELGETGEFSFPAVPPGRVEIGIRTADSLLTLAPIDPMHG